MAAPSGTVWGSIASGYHKLGIYTKLTNTATSTILNVEVWLATKYSVNDPNNTFYYDITTSASAPSSPTKRSIGSIKTSVDSGTGWSSSNHVKLASYEYTNTRGTDDLIRYIHVKLTGLYAPSNSNTTVTASRSYTIPKRTTYTVSYNAQGGTGAPATQTKTHGIALTLSSTKPTRTGYTFLGWGTSKTDTSPTYSAGQQYTANASIVLYAVWKINTYTISYDANGGTGAPDAQTKTYAIMLTLSKTKPTRTGYTFLGWGTSASDTAVKYKAGGTYPYNEGTTLYAIWRSLYSKPRITKAFADRWDTASEDWHDEGKSIKVGFDWATDDDVTSVKVRWKVSTDSSYSSANYQTITASGKGATGVTVIIGNDDLEIDNTYTVEIIVTDGQGTSTATKTVNGIRLPIDVLYQNKGIAFGKPASLDNTAEFEYDVQFNNPVEFKSDAKFSAAVYGRLIGLDSVPAISANSDLDNYLTPGCYKITSNSNASSITNIPTAKAGRLIVTSSTGAHFTSIEAANVYITQEYVPYDSPNSPSYKRFICTDSNKVPAIGKWVRLSGKKILWEGSGLHMNADQTIQLNELVSQQPTGIVLAFSYYKADTAEITDVGWNTFFVPKNVIEFNQGGGQTFLMSVNAGFSYVGAKYLYIFDSQIKGQSSNTSTGSLSGITFHNDRFVLRKVIGV